MARPTHRLNTLDVCQAVAYLIAATAGLLCTIHHPGPTGLGIGDALGRLWPWLILTGGLCALVTMGSRHVPRWQAEAPTWELLGLLLMLGGGLVYAIQSASVAVFGNGRRPALTDVSQALFILFGCVASVALWVARRRLRRNTGGDNATGKHTRAPLKRF
jgi:hypothetical protein